MTYHFREPKVNERCDCGKYATTVLVADATESGTGHTDEVPLCNECEDSEIESHVRLQ